MLLLQDWVCKYMDNLWLSQLCEVRTNEYSVYVYACVYVCMCLLFLSLYGLVHCNGERLDSNRRVQEN